ncbi:hypothetical protein [Levilactobacillus andaensis]|uniref:hypothetical protein n=1 Tax=Levilactobacillus andaensis TaxID=2799570 RepID=UPI0019442FCD|nr:hypothetical protein [Levilactobacillus andaensis]
MLKSKIMKRNIIITLVGLVILVVAGGVMYFQSDMFTRNQLDGQVNRMIQNKDHQKMKKLSVNKATYDFLKKTSVETKVSHTSDSQGGSDRLLYYVTTISGKDVSVYMKKTSQTSWELNSIGLQ